MSDPIDFYFDFSSPYGYIAATRATEMKKRAHNETEAAIKRGVFGSPFFIVEGEPLWGLDGLEQVDEWLESGGF
jgi:2-hydroxychromene-2-carboxylate isomerase